MTKPGADDEGFRPQLMTKASLHSKAWCNAGRTARLGLTPSQPGPLKFNGEICKLVWINKPWTLLDRLNFLEFKAGYPLLNSSQAL